MKIGKIETFYVPPRWLFVRVEADEEAEPAPKSLRRFGAGPGGRVAALLLILAVVGIGALVLYLFLSR